MTHFAREYGGALYELAAQEGCVEEVLAQLKMLSESFDAQPTYLALLDNRAVELDERLALLDQAFSGALHPYLLNYLKILTRRGAMFLFGECYDFYRGRYNDAYGVTEAQAVSAAALDARQRQALIARLEALSGKRVALRERVDPDLIGGLYVEMDGRRYDNTLRSRLDRLRRSLAMDSEGKKV